LSLPHLNGPFRSGRVSGQVNEKSSNSCWLDAVDGIGKVQDQAIYSGETDQS